MAYNPREGADWRTLEMLAATWRAMLARGMVEETQELLANFEATCAQEADRAREARADSN